jgi:hypothetical protein
MAIDHEHEERVAQLIAEGLTARQARQEARAERREHYRVIDESRKNARQTQATIRTGLSAVRLITRLFK